MFSEGSFVLLIIAGVLGGIFLASTFSARRSAVILNNEFGTHYTTADLFWAEGTIKDVVQGKKLRVDMHDAFEAGK